MAAPEILSPDALRSELRQGRLYPVYLFAGPDLFRAERTARWLREHALEGPAGELNAQTVWADETTPAEIAEAAAAYPMFGGRRFVWVRHGEKLPSGTALEPLLRYLADPVDSTVLVLSSGKLDRRLRLTAACAESGRVVDFARLSGRDLVQQVARLADEHELRLQPESLTLLVELVGDDLAEIDQELCKLALQDSAAEGAIEPDTLRRLVARSRDVEGFELADRLDPSQPQDLLHGWMESRRRGTDPYAGAAILSWRLRQLVQFAEARAEGLDAREAGTRLGMAPWQVKRLSPLLRGASTTHLQKLLEALRQADRRAKSSSLGAGVSYDLALLALAGRRAP